MILTQASLDTFVAEVDRRGGPATKEGLSYIRSATIDIKHSVDESLNPDSGEYRQQMLQLYSLLSGRDIDPHVNELAPLDIAPLLSAECAYGWADTAARVAHYLRLCSAFEHADLHRGNLVLDAGCGWGFSSELLASLGMTVTALDINPDFVALVEYRSKRLGLPITAVTGSFSDIALMSSSSFDAVLFYESLHHSMHLRETIGMTRHVMKDGARLVLSGEPITDDFWPSWGLRLEPLSIYCIRKFGWFESSWSWQYLRTVLVTNGFAPTLRHSYMQDPFVVAAAVSKFEHLNALHFAELTSCIIEDSFWIDSPYLISNRQGTASSLIIPLRDHCTLIRLHLENFYSRDLLLRIFLSGTATTHLLSPGTHCIAIEHKASGGAFTELGFECESWQPASVFASSDARLMGFHLRSIEYT